MSFPDGRNLLLSVYPRWRIRKTVVHKRVGKRTSAIKEKRMKVNNIMPLKYKVANAFIAGVVLGGVIATCHSAFAAIFIKSEDAVIQCPRGVFPVGSYYYYHPSVVKDTDIVERFLDDIEQSTGTVSRSYPLGWSLVLTDGLTHADAKFEDPALPLIASKGLRSKD